MVGWRVKGTYKDRIESTGYIQRKDREYKVDTRIRWGVKGRYKDMLESTG